MSLFTVQTRTRRQMVNVTDRVLEQIAAARCETGMALITVLHTTCALLVNDAHSGWEEDMLAFLERAVPAMSFRHLHDGPEHAKSHILGALLGPTLSIAIEGGRPVLGTWQSLFLVELEGPRERKISVNIVFSAGAR